RSGSSAKRSSDGIVMAQLSRVSRSGTGEPRPIARSRRCRHAVSASRNPLATKDVTEKLPIANLLQAHARKAGDEVFAEFGFAERRQQDHATPIRFRLEAGGPSCERRFAPSEI